MAMFRARWFNLEGFESNYEEHAQKATLTQEHVAAATEWILSKTIRMSPDQL